jgi:hypothetical protein
MASYKNVNHFGAGGYMTYIPVSFARELGEELVCVMDKESNEAIHLYSIKEAKKRGIKPSLRNTRED